MRKIAAKMVFCVFAFSAGMAFGVAAEAAELGLPITGIFLD